MMQVCGTAAVRVLRCTASQRVVCPAPQLLMHTRTSTAPRPLDV
jgi:hypothetical protein